MPKTTQYTVALDNKPGALAKLCANLRKAEVNLVGISALENSECGFLRLCATPAAAAKRALDEHGYAFTTQQVLVVRPINQPGEMEKISRKLAKAGVNIQYIYGSSGLASSSTLIIGVSDINKAVAAVDDGSTRARAKTARKKASKKRRAKAG